MIGVRFYADFGTAHAKRKGGDAPNALAVLIDTRQAEDRDVMYDAVAAAYEHPNSGVCSTGVSRAYLRQNCKRISQAEAFRIHPNLRHFMCAATHKDQDNA